MQTSSKVFFLPPYISLALIASGCEKKNDACPSLSATRQWLNGDVRVRFASLSSNWPASSGKVYVTVNNNNNKVTATFCSVEVSAQTFVFHTTAGARITEE